MSKPRQALSILLVEDSPADSRLLLEALRPAVHSGEVIVQTVKRLGQAADELKSSTFSCVLLDLGLPDGQGVGNVSALRQVDHQSAIVVLTGLDDEALATEALKLGAQDYLVKGRADGESLMRIVHRAVERNRRLVGMEERRDQAFFEASHDLQTLLPNAALSHDRGRLALTLSQAHEQAFHLAQLELQGLGAVRDRDGAAIADECLRQAALELSEGLPPAATLGRLESHRFVLFGLPEAALKAQLERAAQRLDKGSPPLGLRYGLASATAGMGFEEILKAAEPSAEVPAAGAAPGMDARPIPTPAGAALEFVRWLPWMDLRTGQYAGIEMVSERGGDDSADRMRATASHLATQWQEWLATRFEPTAVALALPVGLLTRKDAVQGLLQSLQGGASPSRVRLHVGMAAFRDLTSYGEGLGLLRSAGYRLVLDVMDEQDISLRTLTSYPVDAYRLGPPLISAFLAEGLQGPARRALTALLGAAQALGVQVMASGVDSEQALSALRILGLHQVQGRAVAPESSADALPFLWERRVQAT